AVEIHGVAADDDVLRAAASSSGLTDDSAGAIEEEAAEAGNLPAEAVGFVAESTCRRRRQHSAPLGRWRSFERRQYAHDARVFDLYIIGAVQMGIGAASGGVRGFGEAGKTAKRRSGNQQHHSNLHHVRSLQDFETAEGLLAHTGSRPGVSIGT